MVIFTVSAQHGALNNGQVGGVCELWGFPQEHSIKIEISRTTKHHVCLSASIQVDYGTFFPNAPLLLHKPPPTTKGQTSQETILETLPTLGEIAIFNITALLLSEKYTDQVRFGFTKQRNLMVSE